MTLTDSLGPAFNALDRCEAALEKLHGLCCEPSRSPSMAALAEKLAQVRTNLTDVTAGDVVAHLEDAGAQVGRLQVGCCAPNRLKYYTQILKDLTAIQLDVSAALDRDHAAPPVEQPSS